MRLIQLALPIAAGAYSFPSLQAVSYKLRVEVPGFAPAERTADLTANLDHARDLDYPLAGTYLQRPQAVKRRDTP